MSVNPKILNTAAIKQFGFTATIDLENRKLIFDVSNLTVYGVGGAALVQGINFEVTDPSGIKLSAIDFPSKDINPVVGESTYELALPSGISLFGWYTIKGAIKDADGKIYTIELPAKEVCEPKGWLGEHVDGSFEMKTDCSTPSIRISETTNLTYLGKDFATRTQNATLYYPNGTSPEWNFTKTPVQTRKVYTGDYWLRAKTTADYHLDDYFFVRIAYYTKKKQAVTCRKRVAEVMCCIMEKQDEASRNAGNNRGRNALDKLNQISVPLLLAVTKESTGKDPSEEIAQIKSILNCEDCGCDGLNSLLETQLINGDDIPSYSFEGAGATDVDVVNNDETKNIVIKTKYVVVNKKVLGDLSFLVEMAADADNIFYSISFDYFNLSKTILETIRDNQTLKELLNSLVVGHVSGVVDMSFVNGKCVFDTTKFDYSLTYRRPAASVVTVKAIRIDGDLIQAPEPYLTTQTISIKTWLDAIGIGTFTITSTTDTETTLLVQKTGSTAVLGGMVFTEAGVDTEGGFIRVSKSLQDVIQSVIDYLCALSTLTVKLGKNDLKVRELTEAGYKDSMFGEAATLYELLKVLLSAHNGLVDAVGALSKPSCEDMKNLFTATDTDLLASDSVYGTKGGACAGITVKELAIEIMKLAQSDADVNTEFGKVTVDNSGATISSFTLTTTLE